ncbi:hypothetical protein FE391_02265 [Nonomuraea sp. KC401]|uniref:hypothetical protein n=1 Tax=unclassified Nonomuraea TaxID=2593643 RepID=UPI0010FF4D13|nr:MULTISPECIES: hypothetical protein [unclassified Nonomuraea]NBE93641.1 hypothetical protein [Nonomuraea sp. K271]TLF85262.1 hypothetical protein FE391_02265 [Nonomuraea sp. KC401]
MARRAAAIGASTAVLAALAAGLASSPAQAATMATAASAKAKASSKVTVARPKASTRSYEGSCPVKVNFSAKVKVPVKGKTQLAYRWLHGDGSKSKVKTITLKGKGTKTVTVKQSITFKDDIKKGWEAVQVLGPKKVTSKKGYFSVSCEAEKKLKEVRTHLDRKMSARAWVHPSRYVGSCNPGDRIGVAGVIKTDRPSWVRYRWVLNGDVVDYGKVKVRDARKVGFSFAPRHSQRGWAQLQVLRPDTAYSNRAYYKVWCKDDKPSFPAPDSRTKVSASSSASTTNACSLSASGTIRSTGAARVKWSWTLNGATVSSGVAEFGRHGGSERVSFSKDKLTGRHAHGGNVTLSVTGPNNSDSSTSGYAPCSAPAPLPKATPTDSPSPVPSPRLGDK